MPQEKSRKIRVLASYVDLTEKCKYEGYEKVIKVIVMKNSKVRLFLELAGQPISHSPRCGDESERKLGAQLLLSEVLEYVVHGLGVTPVINGQPIIDPEALTYEVGREKSCDTLEMVDGLADVAYTMYWNQLAFGLPLEQAFELVCDNNLTKFVKLQGGAWKEGELAESLWHCGQGISWPAEVKRVEVQRVNGDLYAIGKDARGKVRKPSSYQSVDLSPVLSQTAQ